jgi:glycosyltransferase involved in cell wall biosynthesis
MKISVCIITLNEESNLRRCIRSCLGFSDEIIVVDSGSQDGTQKLAEEEGAKFMFNRWNGFVDQKNFALDQAKNDWIFCIDADEEISKELADSILNVKGLGYELLPCWYSISRQTFHEGRWIRHGDWFPDELIRFFRRGRGLFEGGRVHERLEVEGKGGTLSGLLRHYSYAGPLDFWNRCGKYADLWAASKFEDGRRVGRMAAVSHMAGRWVRAYLLKGGFLDGFAGFQIALFASCETYLKYSILADLCRAERNKK